MDYLKASFSTLDLLLKICIYGEVASVHVERSVGHFMSNSMKFQTYAKMQKVTRTTNAI